MAKGFKSGGRQPGSQNKRTIQKVVEASQQVGEIKKLGQKKATEVLNDLMQTSMSFAARYQGKILQKTQANQEPSADELANFWKAMECAGTFAKALAPFQDPTFKAISVSMAPTTPTAPAPMKQVEGKVVQIDDPVALARVYSQMVKRVA